MNFDNAKLRAFDGIDGDCIAAAIIEFEIGDRRIASWQGQVYLDFADYKARSGFLLAGRCEQRPKQYCQ